MHIPPPRECICHYCASGVLTRRVFLLGCVGADQPPAPPSLTPHSEYHKGLLVTGSEVAFAWAGWTGARMSLTPSRYLYVNGVSIVPLFVRCVYVCI